MNARELKEFFNSLTEEQLSMPVTVYDTDSSALLEVMGTDDTITDRIDLNVRPL